MTSYGIIGIGKIMITRFSDLIISSSFSIFKHSYYILIFQKLMRCHLMKKSNKPVLLYQQAHTALHGRVKALANVPDE